MFLNDCLVLSFKKIILPRQKKYNEIEVIEKAMNLFWTNGYETTSMQMLEKEMGINKFSIYASFGSKTGLLVESIKFYQGKLNVLVKKLSSSSNGIVGIKQYYYDFIEFTKIGNFGQGCLVTSTMNELGTSADDKIKELAYQFSTQTYQAFYNNLSQDESKSKEQIDDETNFLITALMGLTFATRMFTKTQVENYIEHIFKRR